MLKGIYNTCAIHTQVNRQAGVARIFFAGFSGIFSTSINKTLLEAQIKEYNTKLSTTPKTYDGSQHNTNTLPTAPQLPSLNRNHPLSLVTRNFRNLALVNIANSKQNHIQSPIHHIVNQQSQNDNTYEKIIEQPHTTNFQSQNNHFLARDDPTNWIPSPFNFPSSQSPKPNSHHPTSPPESPHINTSSGMDSDANSDITVFNTISQFNNSDRNPGRIRKLRTPFDPFTHNPKLNPPLPSLVFPK